ncbi:MAG: hypothetical protein NVS2B16_37280 [Chloroflexota bacterium]
MTTVPTEELDPLALELGGITQRIIDINAELAELAGLPARVDALTDLTITIDERDWIRDEFKAATARAAREVARRQVIQDRVLNLAQIPAGVILGALGTGLLHHLHWLGI